MQLITSTSVVSQLLYLLNKQILRKMADEAVGNMTRGQEEEVEEQEEALLTRARDALYLTMDRTRDKKHHVSTN